MKETPMIRIEAMLDYVNGLPGFQKLNAYDRRLIILERYLSTYMGFKLGPDDPIGSLFMTTPKEDYRTHSRMNLRLDQFIANEIKDAFGFNLTEFLELPTFFMEDLLAKQRKSLKERREIVEKQKREAARNAGHMLPPEFSGNMHSFNP